MQCSIARALDIVGEWWTPLILRDVFRGIRVWPTIVGVPVSPTPSTTLMPG